VESQDRVSDEHPGIEDTAPLTGSDGDTWQPPLVQPPGPWVAPGPDEITGYQPRQSYPAPGPSTQPYGVQPPQSSSQSSQHSARARVPGWLWPVMSVLALLIGVVGGVAGGAAYESWHRQHTEGQLPGGLADAGTVSTPPLPAGNHSVAAVAQQLLPSTIQVLAQYHGRKDGATLALGGEILSEGDLGKGFFYAPTVFTDVNYRMRIAQEEIFGPTLSVLKVSSYDEAVTVANSTEYGLSSSIYTQDVNTAFRATQDLESGITYVNAPTIGAEIQLPFGGVKATGNGHREAGTSAVKEFTEIKSVYVDYSGKLQRAQIDVDQHGA